MQSKTLLLIDLVSLAACHPHQQKNYLPLVKEIHQMECEHLQKANVSIDEKDPFEFRSIAFKYLLENPDRKILAHYEELSNHLATMESFMDDDEKAAFNTDLQAEYAGGCK